MTTNEQSLTLLRDAITVAIATADNLHAMINEESKDVGSIANRLAYQVEAVDNLAMTVIDSGKNWPEFQQPLLSHSGTGAGYPVDLSLIHI